MRRTVFNIFCMSAGIIAGIIAGITSYIAIEKHYEKKSDKDWKNRAKYYHSVAG